MGHIETEEQRSEQLVEYFLSHLESLCRLSVAELRDVLQLASHIVVHDQSAALKNKALDLLYHCCFYAQLDLRELWNIYWILTFVLFVDCTATISGSMDLLYRKIFMQVRQGIREPYAALENPDAGLVVMVASQFLGIDHAPTRRILDYAYAISTELDKRVLILNDSCNHFYPCACLEQDWGLRYRHELESANSIGYKGIDIPFLQVSGYMPDLYIINETLQKIYQMRPALVYNIGGSSLLADLCGLFTKTACFPCSTDIPISMSRYLLVGRELNENDAARQRRMEPYQEIIETVINYELSEEERLYDCEMFGLPADVFVIGIVGTRLDMDITDDFILLMDQAICQWDVYFLLIGPIDHQERFKNTISKMDHVCLTGGLAQTQTSQAMELLDIYWNPKRSGGGRSSFEALAHGVPVTTLRSGDVYHTCGDAFGVDTYYGFLEQLGRYVNDIQYKDGMKRLALERAKLLSDIPGTQGAILQRILG